MINHTNKCVPIQLTKMNNYDNWSLQMNQQISQSGRMPKWIHWK